ncbi:MAG: hypothetical protein ABI594_16570 [Ginsengibacter sp.]
MRFYKIIGFAAAAIMIISCFVPWAYYADIGKSFNGFFSEKNMYGKPGMFIMFFAVMSIVLIYLNKIWAKRLHIILSAINIGYLIRIYILFTSCYNAYCPEKRAGLYLLIISSVVMMVVSLLPDMKIADSQEEK